MQSDGSVKVALESLDGTALYASTVFGNITANWEHYEAALKIPSDSTDPNGRLSISFTGPGTLTVDVVSLIPEANALKSGLNPWPFREDLLQRLHDLEPK